MRAIILFIFMLICLVPEISAQKRIISGTILDHETGKPIAGAHIHFNKQYKGVVSNSNGSFSMETDLGDPFLIISHIGYETLRININDYPSDGLIKLNKKIYQMDDIDVYGGKVINLIEKQPLYVSDYEFMDDLIVLLAYRQRSIFKPELYLLETSGDSLASLPVKKPKGLFKDCTGQVHYLSRDEINQIYYHDGEIRLIWPYPVYMLDSVLSPCIEKMGSNYYFHQYFYRNQLLVYYYFNKDKEENQLLSVISDSLRLLWQRDEARFAAMGRYDQFDQLFADMIVYAPLYAPLRRVGSDICIFDFTNGKILFYNDAGEQTKETNIVFQKEKSWKKEIYVDEVSQKVYTLFMANGISTLRGIDLDSGQLTESWKIPEYPFIEKIRVYAGSAYFLYKEDKNLDYKKLYKMGL
jgi:hypothetical protein